MQNTLSKSARDTIASIRKELIPGLEDLCNYVYECVAHYEEDLDSQSPNPEADEFLKRTLEPFKELLSACEAEYNIALDAMNKVSIDFTGVDITE